MSRKALLFLCTFALVPVNVSAQAARVDSLKRVPPPPTARPTCAPTPPPKAPTDAQRRQARNLAQNGRQAAILGDSANALTQMREASLLDPTDADLAYQLARAYEIGGAAANAAKEYCRFLAIAPNAPEAAEARNRAAALAPTIPNSASTVAGALFTSGVAAYDRRQLAEAEAKFSGAINAEPTWADAYYDRALVRTAQGDLQRARIDFEEYLRLKPQAPDRARVVARIESLRQRPPSPGQALGLGLIVPGAGQFYTRRPVPGVLSLVGASAALGFAVQQHTSTTTVEETAIDPFGNPYTFTTTRQTKERSNLVPGLALAGAIAVGSGIEAFLYARRTTAEAKRVSMSVAPAGTGFVARVSLLLR
jgi:tetratricopeptide (TPR) repeat protein